MKTSARLLVVLIAILSMPSLVRAEHYNQVHIKIISKDEVRLEGKLCPVKDLTRGLQELQRTDAKLVVRIVVPMAPNRKFLKEVTDCCRQAGVTLTLVVQTS